MINRVPMSMCHLHSEELKHLRLTESRDGSAFPRTAISPHQAVLARAGGLWRPSDVVGAALSG
jgi:hypothetical protein